MSNMFESKRSERFFILYTALSFLFSIFSYVYIDKPVAIFFHDLAGSSVEHFFDFLTEYGEGFYWIVYPGLIYIIYRLSLRYSAGPVWLRNILEKNREYRMRVMGFIALTAIVSGLAVNIFKLIFARYRPVEYLQNDNYGFSWFDYGYRMASFPSGHSATALGVALALVLLFPRYLFLILPLGILIVFSRVVVTAHYLSDVVIGGYVGVITTLYLYRRFFDVKVQLPK